MNLLREIQHCKLLLILFCSFVVCFCGFDFVVEGSYEFALAGIAYLDSPFLFSFVPAHSFIF